MSYLTPMDEIYCRFRVCGHAPVMSARFAGYGDDSESRSAINEVSPIIKARMVEMGSENPARTESPRL